jgi:hypothetical protein
VKSDATKLYWEHSTGSVPESPLVAQEYDERCREHTACLRIVEHFHSFVHTWAKDYPILEGLPNTLRVSGEAWVSSSALPTAGFRSSGVHRQKGRKTLWSGGRENNVPTQRITIPFDPTCMSMYVRNSPLANLFASVDIGTGPQ